MSTSDDEKSEDDDMIGDEEEEYNFPFEHTFHGHTKAGTRVEFDASAGPDHFAEKLGFIDPFFLTMVADVFEMYDDARIATLSAALSLKSEEPTNAMEALNFLQTLNGKIQRLHAGLMQELTSSLLGEDGEPCDNPHCPIHGKTFEFDPDTSN